MALGLAHSSPKNVTPGLYVPTMECSVAECEKRAVSRGFCDTHYRRWRKYGDPLLGARSVIKPCSVEGCPNPAEARTLCHGHYLALLRRGEWPKRFLSDRKPKECAVSDCRRSSHARGLCPTHLDRLQKHGDVLADTPPFGKWKALDT
jgi:hypothetical protein